MKTSHWILLLALLPLHGFAMDDMSPPAQWMLDAEKLEWRDAEEGNLNAWEVSAWYGGDLYKATVASEGEALDSETESHETRLGMQKAIAPFWNLNAGWRHDWKPDDPERDWVWLGVDGTAPWFIETDAKLFVGEDGLTSLRLVLGYEIMFTQKLALEPELEVDIYGKDDDELGIQSGFTSTEAGLRLHYAFLPQFAPYIGVNHERALGDTADLSAHAAETTFVAGLSVWY